MPPATKIELYAAIRRDDRAGLSSRAIQRKHGVGRRTVVKALASVWPEPRKRCRRGRPGWMPTSRRSMGCCAPT